MSEINKQYFDVIEEGNGFCVASVREFGDLLDYLQSGDGHKGWVFRGQSDSSWDLSPSLYRGCSNANPAGLAVRHLEKFKIYARGRVPNTDGWGDERYWALGRHYGLKTPLLDWSASPFIALFFAFCDGTSLDNDRALYSLDASYVNRVFCQRIGERLRLDESLRESFEDRYDLSAFNNDEKSVILGRAIIDIFDSDLRKSDDKSGLFKDFISSSVDNFIRLLSPKTGDNPRLLNQRGVFTYQTSIEPIERIIKSSPVPPKQVLLKIVIPKEIRHKVLTFLNNMNINHLSLFPDLEGASKYCNEKLLEEVSADVTDLNINRIWL